MLWDSHILDLRSILKLGSSILKETDGHHYLGVYITIKSLPKQTRLLDSLLVVFTHVRNKPRKQHTELWSDHLLNTHLLYGTRTPKILIIILRKCRKEQHALCVATLHLAQKDASPTWYNLLIGTPSQTDVRSTDWLYFNKHVKVTYPCQSNPSYSQSNVTHGISTQTPIISYQPIRTAWSIHFSQELSLIGTHFQNPSPTYHLYRNSSKQLPTYEKWQKQTKQLSTCALHSIKRLEA